MGIIIAVVFFLVGTTLNVDYAMWNEETHNEYQQYMQNIMEGNISVAIPVAKEQFEEYAREEGNYTFYYLRVGKSFEEWKHDNSKSYWTDLTKRLRVVAVSADECNNFSLYEVGDEYRGYTDTYMPYLSSYMEFCKFFTQTENIRMLVLDDSYRREYTDVNESQIIGRQFNAGMGVSAVYHAEYGAMLKVSRCGCNNEYKYIQPVFVVHHEDYLEFYKILESVYNISTQIKEPPQEIPTVLEVNITTPDAPILNPCDAYINNSNWKCEYNESTGHIWITAVGWCNNCEGEGCEPEELPEPPKITSITNSTEDDLVYNVDGGVGIELSYPFYRGKYVGNNAQIDTESDEEFTWEVEEEPPTLVWSNSTGTNPEDYLEFVKQYWGCCEPMVLPYPSSEDQIKNMYQVMTYFNPWWVSR